MLRYDIIVYRIVSLRIVYIKYKYIYIWIYTIRSDTIQYTIRSSDRERGTRPRQSNDTRRRTCLLKPSDSQSKSVQKGRENREILENTANFLIFDRQNLVLNSTTMFCRHSGLARTYPDRDMVHFLSLRLAIIDIVLTEADKNEGWVAMRAANYEAQTSVAKK